MRPHLHKFTKRRYYPSFSSIEQKRHNHRTNNNEKYLQRKKRERKPLPAKERKWPLITS
ncbi:hypothetical protein GCWU000325_02196 [Alloprevotella tannerae ATCC 51259]|uniref:Uncharacterized protein n=1 Tax=Alloprevotella tannerae ATCC 51259 TaxID=626522 RepID=C9LIY5_9BACT|nr:hypothetical protein GCWU000325_02196 [Alloprevotella tannerae ATCC 51259]